MTPSVPPEPPEGGAPVPTRATEGVVLACPDKFRGTATGDDAARAIEIGAGRHWWDCIRLPLADGGEGTLDVVAAQGGHRRVTRVTGPLGEPVAAEWLVLGSTAYIEMARASGLAIAGGPEGNRPLDATTRGTGELIAAAMAEGVRRVVVTLGGSATTDGGLGALTALEPLSRLAAVELVVACDVDTRFTDAAAVFGPQKGATPAQVRLLTGRLERLADDYRRERGVDIRELAGGGAAGGLAGALASAGARLVSGFSLVAEVARLDERLLEADLVVTGEGTVDAESFNGKVVGGVCAAAARARVPVLAIGGVVLDEVRALDVPGDVTFVSLTARYGLDRARTQTAALVADVVAEHVAALAAGGS